MVSLASGSDVTRFNRLDSCDAVLGIDWAVVSGIQVAHPRRKEAVCTRNWDESTIWFREFLKKMVWESEANGEAYERQSE